jgi:hypothetical protein
VEEPWRREKNRGRRYEVVVVRKYNDWVCYLYIFLFYVHFLCMWDEFVYCFRLKKKSNFVQRWDIIFDIFVCECDDSCHWKSVLNESKGGPCWNVISWTVGHSDWRVCTWDWSTETIALWCQLMWLCKFIWICLNSGIYYFSE